MLRVVVTHDGGHLNFTVLTLVPVLLRLGEDVLWRAPRRTRPAVLLGVTAAAQLLLSEEILLIVLVGAVVTAAAALLVGPVGSWPTVRAAAGGFGVAALTAVVLVALPLAVQLAGPDRASGVNTARFFAQPRDFVLPSTRLLLGSAGQDAALASRGTSRFEDAVYLGVPVLLLLLAVAARWWRRPAVRTVLLAALVLAALSLGSGRHGALWTGWAHPLAFALSPPGASSIVPTRFGLALDVIVAWVLASALDAVLARSPRRGRPLVASAGALALVAAVVISWLPAPPAAQVAAPVPAFFTTAAVRAVPAGARVILLPAPSAAGDGALLDQAVSGIRFSMLGSYAISVDDTGRVDSHASPDPITLLAAGTGDPTSTRCAIARQRVRDVLVVTAEDAGGKLARTTALLYGPPTLSDGGVALWALGDRAPGGCAQP